MPHYKNGREVHIGDHVVGFNCDLPKAAVVIGIMPDSNSCNLALLPLPDYLSHSFQSKNFLHADDIANADIPDSSLEPAAAD